MAAGRSSISLPGRSATENEESPAGGAPGDSDHRLFATPRVCGEQRKESPDSFSYYLSPGGD